MFYGRVLDVIKICGIMDGQAIRRAGHPRTFGYHLYGRQTENEETIDISESILKFMKFE